MRKKYDGWGATDSPRTIDKRKIRRVGRGGLTTHHRQDNNTTGEARQTHHAPSMRETYAGCGATAAPCTIDGRVRRRVGRGGVAMHYRRENNTTGEARQTHHAPSMREKYDGWGVGGSPREDNTTFTTTSSRNNTTTRR